MTENHGKVWWSELMTRDVPGAKDYYETVCGWQIDRMQMPEGDYWLCQQDGLPVAGMMDMSGMGHLDGIPAHWFTYLAVDDVDAAVNETEAAGGVVQRPPWDVPQVGRIAIVTDPTGAPVGLMTPADPAE